MGQANQIFSTIDQKPHIHQRSSTLYQSKTKLLFKTLRIIFKETLKDIQIEDSSMTCGWLLSEVIRLFPSVSPIVGLRCFQRADVIDIWLSDFDRSINIIRDGTILTPILGETISNSLSLDWFNPICVIGKGGFSSVYLVRKKDNGYLYALKVMQKSHIIKENKIKQVLAECSILKKLNHPFIIPLRWAFQTVT